MINRLLVHTRSGSIYTFDLQAMTWSLVNDNKGHDTIIGLKEKGGRLAKWPMPIVGESLTFFDNYNGVLHISPVVLVQDISQ